MPGVLEQRCDALAQERVVVGDHDAQLSGVCHVSPIEMEKSSRVAFIVGMETGDTGARFADVGDLQAVEHAVARILAETDRPVEAYASVLEAIGGSLGWELGAVWELGPEDERLRCLRTWHLRDGAREFESLSERIALASG